MSRWGKMLTAVVLMCIMLLGSIAMAEGIPLEEALLMVGSGEEMVLLSDDFSQYDYYTSEYYTSNTGKFIVLHRVGPEKEFTQSTQSFPDDFNGVDIGEVKVYLDLEMMAQIPEEYRAATVEEVGNIIIVETLYFHTATIFSYEYENSNEPSSWELNRIINNEEEDDEEEDNEKLEKEENFSTKYKAAFTGYAIAAAYNAEDGSSVSFDIREFPIPEMRDNPEAADLTEWMFRLAALYNTCVEANEDECYQALVEMLLDERTDANRSRKLLDAMGNEEGIHYEAVRAYAEELIWEDAQKFTTLDKEYSKLYKKVIDEKSLNGLFYLLNNCNYSGISKSDWEIALYKLYMGKIDQTAVDEMKEEVAEVMDLIGWDPELFEVLLMLSEYSE